MWSTDRNGNYKGNLTGGDVSGTSYALELLEPVFHQDLNRDGVIGSPEIMHTANVALLTQFMAATFAPASNSQGGTMTLAEAVQPSDHFQLATPHHA